MPGTDQKTGNHHVSLLTTIVLLFLIAWAGAATIFMFRADLSRVQTLETLRRTIDDRSLALDEKIRNLERTITNLKVESTTAEKQNIFDVRKVKVGDTVGGMRVLSVRKAIENPNLPFDPFNASIAFSGRVTLSGEVEYFDKDTAFTPDTVCISNLTRESRAMLPTFSQRGDVIENLHICFLNKAESQRAFGPAGSKKNATVEVDAYTINSAETEITDTARFIRVTEK